MESVRIVNNDLVPDVRDVVFDKPLDDEAYEFLDKAMKEAQEYKKNGKIPVPIILNETKQKIEHHLRKRGYNVQEVHCEIDLFI